MENNWSQFYTYLLEFEERGLVTRTFRRLDPERQQAVLTAILDEAGENGPVDINIKQVAARAGVAVGSLYQYFGERENLLRFTEEITVRYVVDMFQSYRPYLAEMPVHEALLAYVQGGTEWTNTQTGFVRFYAKAAYTGDKELTERVVRPIATVMRSMVVDILTAAVARGEIRADLDVEAASRVINALMIAVVDPQLLPNLNNYFQVYDENLPVERVNVALFELIFRGIGKPADM